MIDFTIKEYLNLIESLKFSDLIIYYFSVYFFIILIQRALGFDIETDGRFKTNPKILITLILIQLFQLLNFVLTSLLVNFSYYSSIIATGLIFVFCLFILEKFILSENGVINIFFSYCIKRTANKDLLKNKDEIKELTDKKDYLQQQRPNINFDDIVFKKTRVMNKNDVKSRALSYSTKKKNDIQLLIMDCYICNILLIKLYPQSKIISLLFLFAAVIFLQPRLSAIKSFVREIMAQAPATSPANKQ